MANAIEIARNTALSVSILMPASPAENVKQYDTSSPLDQEKIGLETGIFTNRIDADNPIITIFDQRPAPSIKPLPNPTATPEPTLSAFEEACLLAEELTPALDESIGEPNPSTTPEVTADPSIMPTASTTPEVTASPKPENETTRKPLTKEECKLIALSGRDYINVLANQKTGEDGTINKISYKKMRSKLLTFWKTHKSLMSEIAIPDYDGEKFEEWYIDWTLDVLKNGDPNLPPKKGNTPEQKASYAASLAVVLTTVGDKVTDPYLKRDLYLTADDSFDFGVSLKPGDNPEKSRDFVAKELKNLASYYLPSSQ